jgi:hypothetical protein
MPMLLRSIPVLLSGLPLLGAAELIANPGFDTGISGWTVQIVPFTGGVNVPGKIEAAKDGEDGILRLERTVIGGNMFSVQLYQRAALTPGKRYICKLKARSPNEAWLSVLVMRDEGDYAAATEPVYQGLGKAWTEITLPLAPRAGVAAPLRINFCLDDRTADKVVEITSVSLEPVE